METRKARCNRHFENTQASPAEHWLLHLPALEYFNTYSLPLSAPSSVRQSSPVFTEEGLSRAYARVVEKFVPAPLLSIIMNNNLSPHGALASHWAGSVLAHFLFLLMLTAGISAVAQSPATGQGAAPTLFATVPPTPGTWTGIREDGAVYPNAIGSIGRAVATDPSGNVVIAGRVDGTFTLPRRDSIRAVVAKYSVQGALLWAQRIETASPNSGRGDAYGIATDKSGNIYVAGQTTDPFPGEAKVITAGTAAFLVKYDPNGNRVWVRQFRARPEFPSTSTVSRGVAVDGNDNILVVGHEAGSLPAQSTQSHDYFLAKFDANGNRLWFQKFGTALADYANAVAIDASGNAYIAGTAQQPGGIPRTPFVAKHDANGVPQWRRELLAENAIRRAEGHSVAVSADGMALYLAGRTNVDFDRAGTPYVAPSCCARGDAFVARLDGAGSLQWIHNLSSVTQNGTTYLDDQALGVTTPADGSAAFVAGFTQGVMPGEISYGGNEDIFVARYEASGARTWVRQLGASVPTNIRPERGYGIALNLGGDIFVVGETTGTFGTPNRTTASAEWFVFKMRPADGAVY